MIVLGIDPGVNTGLAEWSCSGAVLGMVESMAIHQALDYVRAFPQASHPGELLVIFEDARQRTWFGSSGKEVWQGAGSIKRDCTIWQDFLTDAGIAFIAQPPARNSTKLPSDRFKVITGWQGRTNEHGRDAAMLVYGISSERAHVLLNTAKRRAA